MSPHSDSGVYWKTRTCAARRTRPVSRSPNPAAMTSATVLCLELSSQATIVAAGACHARRDHQVRRRRARSRPVKDLRDIVGKRPQEQGVLIARFDPADLSAELVMQPDQVGDHRFQDDPLHAGTKPLILLVQPVDDRFPVCRTPVELSELFFQLAKSAAGSSARTAVSSGSGPSMKASSLMIIRTHWNEHVRITSVTKRELGNGAVGFLADRGVRLVKGSLQRTAERQGGVKVGGERRGRSAAID